MWSTSEIYKNSPEILQNAAVSVMGLKFRFLRANSWRIRRRAEILRKQEHWSVEKQNQHQLGKLRQLVAHSISTIPFYKKRFRTSGLTPEDIRSFSDYRRLPILEKEDLRGNETKFISSKFERSRLYENRTSGSTGTPIRTFESRQSFSDAYAHVIRLRQWAGLRDCLFPRRAQFTGRPVVMGDHPSTFWRYNFPGNALVFSAYHLSPETIGSYVKALKSYSPDLIDGFPSSFVALCRMASIDGLHLPPPKAIITTSETLLGSDRAEIETGFSCNVFDQYASSEPTCFWSTCEMGKFHIHTDYGISEIIAKDGESAAPGEVGEVVTTSLLNPVMPLLRYRLGDLGRLSNEEFCECGRTLPIAEEIVGRKDDTIYTPQRGFQQRLDMIYKGVDGIIESQLIQTSLTSFEIKVVTDNNFTPRESERLEKNLRERVGEGVTIKITYPARIKRVNGKFRAIVSKVKHLYPDQEF